ncbi:aldehyde-activating protein [archaeon]|nr:MAG: aldehyde-activating protein [archaeon]
MMRLTRAILNRRAQLLAQNHTFYVGVMAQNEAKSPKLRNLQPLSGCCSCGNIEAVVNLSKPSIEYTPRCCDCDFCTQRAAAYVSDPQGSLRFIVKDPSHIEKRYQDADGIAQFLICKRCDTLVGATYTDNNVYGTLNQKILGEQVLFSPSAVASPKTLDKRSKVSRWRELWFRNVVIEEVK